MDRKNTQKEVPRKRGRPSGKGRKPLSAEERRARNAQYERERRVELAEATEGLARAASDVIGCENNLSTTELLSVVINYIHRQSTKNREQELHRLRERNALLKQKLSSLWSEIGKNELSPSENVLYRSFPTPEDNYISPKTSPTESNVRETEEVKEQLINDAIELLSSSSSNDTIQYAPQTYDTKYNMTEYNTTCNQPSQYFNRNIEHSELVIGHVETIHDYEINPVSKTEISNENSPGSYDDNYGYSSISSGTDDQSQYITGDLTHTYKPYDPQMPLSMFTVIKSNSSPTQLDQEGTSQSTYSSDWSDVEELIKRDLGNTSIDLLFS